MTRNFFPSKYQFQWTEKWYEWDHTKAHTDARKARDEAAKALKAQGIVVRKGSVPNQQITLGGIGSGRPEVTLFCTVYTLTTL